jgi:hypothetical protein
MKMMQTLLVCAFVWAMCSGCSGPQYEYKPLYQAEPEKEKLSGEE